VPESRPVAAVAAALNIGIRQLERRCAGAVFRDDDGIPCFPRHIVAKLMEEHDEKLSAQREARNREREHNFTAPRTCSVTVSVSGHEPRRRRR
jgi:hypothetical protein